MAPNSIFGRDDDHTEAEPASEGVRVLGADEVAKAAEKAEAAKRLGPGDKKYGDRPEPPPADVKPALRFPLSGSSDPTDFDRPRTAPMTPRTAEDPTGTAPARSDRDEDHRFDASMPSGEDLPFDAPMQPDEDLPFDASMPSDGDLRFDAPMQPDEDRPFDASMQPDDDLPFDAPMPPDAGDVEPAGGAPMLSVGPPTGETSLPHWTEPATGEVPRVVIGDTGGEVDDDGKWAAFAASSPRWRDQSTDWDTEAEGGFEFVHDDDSRIGALDETERPKDEDYLTFEDLEVPDAASPVAARRGSPDDPIRIQTEGRRPAAAVGEQIEPDAPVGRDDRGRPPADADVAVGEAPVTAGSGRDRQQAIQVGAGVAGGALVIFLLGAYVAQWIPLLLVTAAVVGSLAEFFNATGRAGFRPLREIGLVAAAALPLAAYATGSPAVPMGESGMMLVLFLTLVASMAWYLFGAGKGRPVANMAITLFGVFYVGALGAFGALILRAGPWANVAPSADPAIQGVAYFIVIALGTTMYDAVGYLAGSRIGKTPLSEASPNKTLEGLGAGMAASFVTVVIFGGLFGIGLQNIGQALVLGVIIALVAPVGDLFESMVKRDLGVKDMGSVLPSHGGLLDRLDAYLFTLPAAYYTLRMLGLIG